MGVKILGIEYYLPLKSIEQEPEDTLSDIYHE